MTQIVLGSQLNLSALSADDAYIDITSPPGYIQGVPTDVMGFVGTASWGPVDQAVHLGSGPEGVSRFGPVSSAALTDPYDLATDILLAFGQASSLASAEAFCVRVSDGTDVAASKQLEGTASQAEAVTIGGTITAGDIVSLTISGGPLTSPAVVTYTVQSSDTVDTVAAGLALAVNNSVALKNAFFSATSTSGSAVFDVYYPGATAATFTDSSASGVTETLTSATTTGLTNGMTVSAFYTGVLGNGITVTIQAGSLQNTFTVIVQPPPGLGLQSETYPNLPSTGFWSALSSALLNGVSSRGPSQLLKPSAVIPGVGAPTAGTFTLSGGTDGRAGVTTSTLLGTNGTPPTGVWALANTQPAVGVAWLTGCHDSTAYPTMLQFGQSVGCLTLNAMPSGTSTSQAQTIYQTAGIEDPSFAYVNDWIYWLDTANNQMRLSPPTAVIGGHTAVLSPEQSPGNKAVYGIIGTTRNGPNGNVPYTPSEVGQLESIGVLFISNPIPAGNIFGLRHGQTTSNNQATKPVEYWRMTSFIARSFATVTGQYVDQLQSAKAGDPLRRSVRTTMNQFLKQLQGNNQIDSYNVICTYNGASNATPGNGINTNASIAQHYMYALAKVKYLSSVRFFILAMQGGTTVVTVQAAAGA